MVRPKEVGSLGLDSPSKPAFAGATQEKPAMEFTLQEETMEVTRDMARLAFAGDSDREAKVNDAVSVAWEMTLTVPPGVTPHQIGANAIKRIKVGRRFKQSVRSLDGPPLDRRNRKERFKPRRKDFDVAELAAVGDDPAKIFQVRHDLEYVFRQLSRRDQAVVVDLAMGETTQAIAKKFAVSDGRISQIKKTLKEKWKALDS
jgi:DNA-binding NarL/FixJ family response regulator